MCPGKGNVGAQHGCWTPQHGVRFPGQVCPLWAVTERLQTRLEALPGIEGLTFSPSSPALFGMALWWAVAAISGLALAIAIALVTCYCRRKRRKEPPGGLSPLWELVGQAAGGLRLCSPCSPPDCCHLPHNLGAGPGVLPPPGADADEHRALSPPARRCAGHQVLAPPWLLP